jgi:hypothetical protein
MNSNQLNDFSFASYNLLPDSGAQTPQPIPDIGKLFLEPKPSVSTLSSCDSR